MCSKKSGAKNCYTLQFGMGDDARTRMLCAARLGAAQSALRSAQCVRTLRRAAALPALLEVLNRVQKLKRLHLLLQKQFRS